MFWIGFWKLTWTDFRKKTARPRFKSEQPNSKRKLFWGMFFKFIFKAPDIPMWIVLLFSHLLFLGEDLSAFLWDESKGTGLPAAGVWGSTGEPGWGLNPCAGQKTCSCPPCLINSVSLRNEKVFGKLASLPSPSGRRINTAPTLSHKHIAQRSGTS